MPLPYSTALALCCVLGAASASSRLHAQAYLGLGVDFGGFARAGSWSQIYGPALATGVRVEGATAKGWVGALYGDVSYGNDVRVDPIAALRTPLGILGDEGGRARPVDVPLRARGFRVAALGGYQANFGKSLLGWRLLAGPSYTQHNIRIQNDATLTTSNLRSDYKPGYDRRAGGLGASAEVALLMAPPSRRYVAYVAATANVFGSRPLRSVQFDLRRQAPASGTDVGLGARVGFVAVLFRPSSLSDAEDIYY